MKDELFKNLYNSKKKIKKTGKKDRLIKTKL
jgi:hypothetical protein